MQIHVLTHNIHKGVSYYSSRRILADLREEIRASQADFVFLQEVRGAFTPDEGPPQYEFLADSVWHDHAYGRNAVYSRGHHGNAILSKYPLIHHHNQDISLNRLERRGLLHARCTLPDGQDLHLFCLHLNLRKVDRLRQMELVIDHLRQGLKAGDCAIMAGDFNDWQGVITDQLEHELGFRDASMEANGAHAQTFPSFLPILRLDRIYYRNLDLAKFEVLSGEHWRRLSDHLALTATFALR